MSPWQLTQIFFLNYPSTPKITLQSAILGFKGGLHGEHITLINDIMLIYTYYSYKSSYSETLHKLYTYWS